jgi:hypothetical protein
VAGSNDHMLNLDFIVSVAIVFEEVEPGNEPVDSKWPLAGL